MGFDTAGVVRVGSWQGKPLLASQPGSLLLHRHSGDEGICRCDAADVGIGASFWDGGRGAGECE